MNATNQKQENEFCVIEKRKRNTRQKKCQIFDSEKTKKAIKTKKQRDYVSKQVFVETNRITLVLPIYTLSEGNTFEKWQVKHARHEAQKYMVKEALTSYKGIISLPCEITLHRIAPRELDTFENLPMSLKWIADACCDFLIPGLKPGRADADRRIKIQASQEKSKVYGVKIIFEF